MPARELHGGVYRHPVPLPELADRVRSICLRLPEATERPSHGSPAFFVGRQFVMLWPDGHHDHDFPHLWCAAAVGVQVELVAASPHRYFRPPYVGARGWVGVRLDREVDWDEIAELCEDAYRVIAPPRLIRLLDQA
jgi:hypothetical protein